jgi:transposase
MSPKPCRKFTVEQKAEAVKIVRESGKSANQVAREMGLTASALRNWIKQAQIDQHRNPQDPLTSSERQQFNELRRELKRVQMERDFLKKAAAFFAKDSSNPMS